MLHCFPHGRALWIEHGDFRHHYHFGFHLSIYEHKADATMVFSGKKFLSKLILPR
jgi:hypothetical protein